MSCRSTGPKFRPEEIAEILGVDRKAVIRLTDKKLIGYYQFGPRTRRIGMRELRKYFSQTQGKAEKLYRERKAVLRKHDRQLIAFLKKSSSPKTLP
jgi:excisionase family DNA binding protein